MGPFGSEDKTALKFKTHSAWILETQNLKHLFGFYVQELQINEVIRWLRLKYMGSN